MSEFDQASEKPTLSIKEQREIQGQKAIASCQSFYQTLKQNGLYLDRRPLKTLQVNIGKRCNQACLHCHVESSPTRIENMNFKTVDRILSLISESPEVQTVDITGGAPELNSNFRYFVRSLREMGRDVIDRCNLTVLYEKGQEDTAEFLADHQVKVVASLPCYSRDNVDQQRGNGVFDKSIRALQLLNQLGYGKAGSSLSLDLVYNPLGASLPPAQETLEASYKVQLKEDFGIEFNRLFTITNMPIKRFLWDLERQGKLEEYMEILVNHFNATAAEEVMCRDLISIGWDGEIFDCDFNQMLDIPVANKKTTLWDIVSLKEYDQGQIAFANHCYACTAGAGSSCGGALL